MTSIEAPINDSELLLRLASRRGVEVPEEIRAVLVAAHKDPASVAAAAPEAAFYKAYEQLAALLGGSTCVRGRLGVKGRMWPTRDGRQCRRGCLLFGLNGRWR
jgi:hypothetical protein